MPFTRTKCFSLPEAAVPDFVSGRVPVGYGSGVVRIMRRHAPDQLDDVWFAGAIEGRGPNATKAAWAGPGAKFIWHDSENPDQSWKLVEFLNSPEYGVRWLEPLRPVASQQGCDQRRFLGRESP